ncbi:MAG: MliC family protein [Rickettsiales bacterium]|jgi:membrane-bound inhibitor of C-type lysozyme|nr:MliC family protein [Rickettsiales bacterium]
MKKACMIAILAAGLAACDEAPQPEQAKEPERVALKCGKYDVAIEISDADTLNAAVNGEKITMSAAVSADGAKYEGKGRAASATLWSKGKNWSLSINGGGLTDCKPVPAPPSPSKK